MPTWREVEQAAPELAARVRALFDAHPHKTIATVRADGSPRISGIEASFADGHLTFGCMPASRKGADLHRDPRFALHSASVDPSGGPEGRWPGDAKVAGRAVPRGAPRGQAGDLFEAEVTEIVHVHLDDAASALVIDWWTPSGGVRRETRR